MLRLNLRKGDSTIRFGKEPVWSDTFGQPITTEAAYSIIAGKQVCLLIHGYNTPDPDGAYARIESHISDLYDVVVGVQWPSSGIKLGYWFAEFRSGKAGRILADTLLDLPRGSLDAEGHSLGCRVALEAVRSGLKVRNLILAAAAVDNESPHSDRRYGASIHSHTDRCLVAHSRSDAVLRSAFPLSRIFDPRRWGRDDCKALGYTGPQDPTLVPREMVVADLTDLIKAHGDYKTSAAFYARWRALCR